MNRLQAEWMGKHVGHIFNYLLLHLVGSTKKDSERGMRPSRGRMKASGWRPKECLTENGNRRRLRKNVARAFWQLALAWPYLSISPKDFLKIKVEVLPTQGALQHGCRNGEDSGTYYCRCAVQGLLARSITPESPV